MTLAISVLSKQYVRVPVDARKNGDVYDPTSDAVVMAFVPAGTAPASGDWKSASWETDGATTSVPTYYARCMVGPGGAAELPTGRYTVWVKITSSPEVPVIQAGDLMIVSA